MNIARSNEQSGIRSSSGFSLPTEADNLRRVHLRPSESSQRLSCVSLAPLNGVPLRSLLSECGSDLI